LVAAGADVRVLDSMVGGRERNLDDLLSKIDWVVGDIRDARVVQDAMRNVAAVFHMAALPSVEGSVQDPSTSHAVNLTGTLNLMVAARDAGVERFIFSSSCAVYGNAPELPKTEHMMPDPLSPYAAQKLAGENYCRLFHDLYGMRTFSLRYFNVFGPRQNPRSQYAAAIPCFIAAARAGRAPIIYGDGEQTRDFVFVEDVVRANLCCVMAPENTAGRVYNIAGGERITVKRVATAVLDIIGSGGEPVYQAARPGEVRHSQSDTSLAREHLNWTPSVGFEEGLRHTVEYFLRRET
jgi:UDP-glucose 4-epimerase